MRRLRWSGAAGVVVSLLLLWWALHDVELGTVWTHVVGLRPVPFALAVTVATLSFPLRAARWRYLLRLEGSPPPYVPVWHATAIGFMANNLLPARAGELARAYAVRRLTAVRFPTALASIAVERVMDGVVLVGLLMIAMWAGGFSQQTAIGGVTLGGLARSAGALFALLLALALVAVHWPRLAVGMVRAVGVRVLPAPWVERVIAVLEGLLAGLEALRRPRQFVVVTAWSVAIWLTMAASFWLAFVAFAIAVPWSAALMLIALVSFGVAIPSAPGFFGVFEAVARAGLALYAVPPSNAVSLAVGYHLATFLPITLLGMWSLSRGHLRLAELRDGGEEGREGK